MKETLFSRVAQVIAPGSRLARAWELKGGVSAQVTALEVERPDGQRQTVVVRRHGPADLAGNPQVAAAEFRLLGLVRSAGLAVPAPLHLDQSGAIFPTPYLVIEYIEGQTAVAPEHVGAALDQMAAYLAKVHTINAANADLTFMQPHGQRFAWLINNRPDTLDDSLDEPRIRAALDAIWPFERRNPAVLLHGDFWPGNIMWRDGRLAAVLDWEDAAVDDPLADLAVSRLDILWAFGAEAMDYFTARYQALSALDWTNLPAWDLCAALRPAGKISGWATATAAEQTMRERHRAFVEQAFARLAAR
jgi:aminoglycoside phosphotransferase (APT) family kinase protein